MRAQPAIELARGGIQPNPYLISTISSLVSTLEDYPGLRGVLHCMLYSTCFSIVVCAVHVGIPL